MSVVCSDVSVHDEKADLIVVLACKYLIPVFFSDMKLIFSIMITMFSVGEYCAGSACCVVLHELRVV